MSLYFGGVDSSLRLIGMFFQQRQEISKLGPRELPAAAHQ